METISLWRRRPEFSGIPLRTRCVFHGDFNVNNADANARLSQISIWTVLDEAHTGPADAANEALQILAERYGPAVKRYLLSLLRDPVAEDDLTQEFFLSLVHGKFHQADPSRGRFRNYFKAALIYLVRKALAANQPLHCTVLRFRAAHAKMPSHEIARELSKQMDKPLSADGVRQTLRRARTSFAELLVQEVANTFAQPTVEGIEQELADLQLLEFASRCWIGGKRKSEWRN